MGNLTKLPEFYVAKDLSLDECKQMLNQVHETYIFIIGEILLQAKAQLPHGGFIPWVNENCPFAMAQAQNYMRVTKRKEEFLEPPTSLKGAIRELNRKDQIPTSVGISKPQTPLDRPNAEVWVSAKLDEIDRLIRSVMDSGDVDTLSDASRDYIQAHAERLHERLQRFINRLNKTPNLKVINNG